VSKFTISILALLISQTILAADNQAPISNQADQLAQTIPLIKQQIADTIQSVKAQEEQIMQKMLQLQQQNDQLREKLNSLNQQINPNANQNAAASSSQSGPACRLAPLQASTTASQNPSPPSSPVITAPLKPSPSGIGAHPHPSTEVLTPVNGFSAYLDRIDWLKTGGLLALLILLIGGGVLAALFFLRERPEKIISSSQQEPMPSEPVMPSPEVEMPSSLGFEEEYDFINSDEAIPLRLDLARAYLEMENYDEAKNALQTVLEKGSPEQKLEAKELMAVINSVV
jgi:FimV-like protein